VQRPETKARARALQILYAWTCRAAVDRDGGRRHRPHLRGRAGGYDRGADLAAQAVAELPEIDRRIGEAAEHWRFERVGVIERNILRLARAELSEAGPAAGGDRRGGQARHWFAVPGTGS